MFEVKGEDDCIKDRRLSSKLDVKIRVVVLLSDLITRIEGVLVEEISIAGVPLIVRGIAVAVLLDSRLCIWLGRVVKVVLRDFWVDVGWGSGVGVVGTACCVDEGRA